MTVSLKLACASGPRPVDKDYTLDHFASVVLGLTSTPLEVSIRDVKESTREGRREKVRAPRRSKGR